jgi:hypothetical protein
MLTWLQRVNDARVRQRCSSVLTMLEDIHVFKFNTALACQCCSSMLTMLWCINAPARNHQPLSRPVQPILQLAFHPACCRQLVSKVRKAVQFSAVGFFSAERIHVEFLAFLHVQWLSGDIEPIDTCRNIGKHLWWSAGSLTAFLGALLGLLSLVLAHCYQCYPRSSSRMAVQYREGKGVG